MVYQSQKSIIKISLLKRILTEIILLRYLYDLMEGGIPKGDQQEIFI